MLKILHFTKNIITPALLLTIFVSVVSAQTEYNPGFTVTTSNADSRAIGWSGGQTYTYTKSGGGNYADCTYWGVYLPSGSSNDMHIRFDQPNAPNGACSFSTSNDVNAYSTGLTGNTLTITGNSGSKCITSSGNWGYPTISTRAILTFNTGGRTWVNTGNYYFVDVSGLSSFSVTVNFQAYGPSGYMYSSSGTGWRPAIELYDGLHTDPNQSICTNFDPEFFQHSFVTTPALTGGTTTICPGDNAGTITAAPTNGSGDYLVTFYRNGSAVGSDNTAPYQFNIGTSLTGSDATYNFHYTVRDNCVGQTYTQTETSATRTFVTYASSTSAPTITSPSSCNSYVGQNPYTFTWNGPISSQTTVHANTQYRVRLNGGGWTNKGSSTSHSYTLLTGANVFEVQYVNGCGGTYTTTCNVFVDNIDNCLDIYVDNNNGNDANIGTPDFPVQTISRALSLVNANRTHIKIEGGTYTSNRINMVNDAILDGGYTNSGGNWEKNSNNSTVLNIIASEENPATNVAHNRGIVGDGVSNFHIKDVTVNINNPSGQQNGYGKSVYGIYLKDASNYSVTRATINAGNATNGANGQVGDDGSNGSNGGNGAQGSCDDQSPGHRYAGAGGNGGGGTSGGSGGGSDDDTGAAMGSAGSGGNASSRRNGGGGGGGGAGLGENRNGLSGAKGGNNFAGVSGGSGGSGGVSHGCDVGDHGNTGGAGQNGGNGTAGSIGNVGTFADYFTPGSQGAKGTDGYGGTGGGGGGGGAGQGGTFCTDGSGGMGGGGGGGGQGGEGGTGGYGGGSTFGIYLRNSNSGSNLLDLNVNGGIAGAGGIGASGGEGGNGGSGGSGGGSMDCGETGNGANGRNGGNGGNGGTGGNGRSGYSYEIYTVGSGASSGTSVPNPVSIRVDYQDNYTSCENSTFTIIKGGGSNWSLPSGLSYINDLSPTTSSYSNSSTTAVVSADDAGFYTLNYGSTAYTDFVVITKNRTLPVINPISSPMCIGDVTIGTPEVADNYNWTIYEPDGGTRGFLTQNPGTQTFDEVGTYQIKLQTEDECCGWSAPVWTEVVVVEDPTAPTFTAAPTSGSSICPGTDIVINFTGGSGGLTCADEYTYTYSGGGSNSGIATGSISIPTTGKDGETITLTAQRNCSGLNCSSSPTFVGSWTVNQSNVAGTSHYVSPDNICSGTTTKLFVDGETLGTGSAYAWYDGPKPTGTLVGYGNVLGELTITPLEDKTYYLYLEGGACADILSGTATVNVQTSAEHVVTPLNIAYNNLEEQCVIDGWTYYATSANPDEWLFAIRKNAQSLEPFFDVDLNSHTGVISSVKTGVNPHGSYLMRRYWNVKLLSGSIDNGIDIRFFYDPADLEAAKDLRDIEFDLYGDASSTKGPHPQWFKTEAASGGFHPSLLTPGMGNNWSFPFTPLGGPGNISSINGNTYVQFDGLTSLSGGTGGTTFDEAYALLPVELASFTATAKTTSIDLNWITASELNNNKFEILRSTDAINFEIIGSVDGNGTTNSTSFYNFKDENVAPNIIYYYKLKQIDFDGTSELSDVVSAVINQSNKFLLSELIPNPAQDLTYIEIITPKAGSMSYILTDVIGQTVLTGDFSLEKGNQRIYFDIADLVAGNYLVNLIHEDGTKMTKKLQIIR